MVGFLKFVGAAFSRSISTTCAAATLLVFGVNPGNIVWLFIENPPWWLFIWWVPYAVVTPAILIMAVIFYRQSLIDRSRPVPFNIPLNQVAHYLALKSLWGVRENPNFQLPDLAIFNIINQAIRDGVVELHGRRQIDATLQTFGGKWAKTWEPIKKNFPDYWEHMEISAGVLNKKGMPVVETQPIRSGDICAEKYPEFTQLRASWPQIELVWPRANRISRTIKRIKLWLSVNT